MPLYQPYFPFRYVAPLLRLLEQQGEAALADILRAAQLGPGRLDSPEPFTFGQFDGLMQAAARRLRRADLGFELGARISMDDHEALSVAMRQCRSGDAMLRMLARYRKLVTNGLFFVYQRQADHGEMTIRPAAALSQATLYAFEELLAVAFHRDFVSLFGAVPGLEIDLSMPTPGHVGRYRALRPTRFHFGANALPEIRCRVPAALLDRPLTPAPAGPAVGMALQAGGREPGSAQYGQWVAMILREAEGVQPSLADLAAMLSISASTLKRQLLAEHTSLSELNRTERLARAKAMLAGSCEPIGQIAYRLGYASAASFFIAFRKGAGMGPRAYRLAARRNAMPAPGADPHAY